MNKVSNDKKNTNPPLPTKLKCLYTNLDGIYNKISEFCLLVLEEDPDLIFLTETKLNPDILNHTVFDVNNYNIYRKDRLLQNAPGGGVAILVKKIYKI